MNVLNSFETTLHDIPGELCLTIAVHGCKKNCKGCQWETWNKEENPENVKDIKQCMPEIMNSDKFKRCTCVLFYGGEWEPETLKDFAYFFKTQNKKTALFSGELILPVYLTNYFDYVKLGPYIEELGPLNSESTNQKLFDNTNHKEIKLIGGLK